MSTTFFPFYKAKQTHNKFFFSPSSSSIINIFIVIIITTQHTYYYNHSSPSHWHFSFALSFHFIPLFRLPHLNTISSLGVFFFFSQSVICSHNTYFRPYNYFSFGTQHHNAICHITQTSLLILIHYIRKRLVIHSINHSFHI